MKNCTSQKSAAVTALFKLTFLVIILTCSCRKVSIDLPATAFNEAPLSEQTDLSKATVFICINGSSGFDTHGILYALNAETGAKRWEYDLHGFIFNTIPCISDSAIYILSFSRGGGTNYLHAIDIATKQQKWKVAVSPGFSYGVNNTSSPCINGRLVYVATYKTVYAFDKKNGRKEWETVIPGQDYLKQSSTIFYSSPTVVDGVLYIGSPAKPVANHLFALDAKTGKIKWQSSTASYLLLQSSPCVSGNTAYIAMGDSLNAIDTKTGQLKWHFYLAYSINSSPALAGSEVYAWGSSFLGYYLYALDTATGIPKWAYKGPDNFTYPDPFIKERIAYHAFGDGLHAIHAETGTTKWIAPIATKGLCSTGGVIYATTSGSGTFNGLYAISRSDGHIRWKFSFGEDIIASSQPVILIEPGRTIYPEASGMSQ